MKKSKLKLKSVLKTSTLFGLSFTIALMTGVPQAIGDDSVQDAYQEIGQTLTDLQEFSAITGEESPAVTEGSLMAKTLPDPPVPSEPNSDANANSARQ